MKRIIICVVSIFLIFSETKAQLTELVAKNEKAIFQIFSYDEFGSPFSAGTGFFVDKSGTGLTNLHVLEDSKFAFIRDFKGNIFQIEKITRVSKDCDIAEFTVGNVANKTFDILNFTANIPPKASNIFVIGNPEGFESTVSTGIISSIREEDKNKIIQVTAPISPGSSGSPIMDMTGNVIGIATYQSKDGQNLNFGYWIGCKENLLDNTEYKLSSDSKRNLYILNKVCETESNLILNSIELNEKNTVLNLSFTNTSLQYGDGAFIFTVIGDKKQSFYIEDESSKNKVYVYDATIGASAKSPTYLKLGETRRFKLFFPPLKNVQEINIKEGMQGADWSFSNIRLNDYKTFLFNDDKFFNNFYFQTGLAMLSNKNYAGAYILLKDFTSKNSDNDYAHNLAGIVSYILGNNLDAFLHIKKAIEINPTNDNYYFNLYFLNKQNGDIDEALKSISSAIQLNDDHPEYYAFRGYLNVEKRRWKEAITDLNKYIDSDREISYYAYFQRALAKLWEREKSACKDLEKAYSIANSDDAKKAIAEWYNKYCR